MHSFVANALPGASLSQAELRFLRVLPLLGPRIVVFDRETIHFRGTGLGKPMPNELGTANHDCFACHTVAKGS